MPATALRLIATLGLGLVALGAHASQVYTWKDAKGVTHYSDSPPPNQPQAKPRTIRTTAGSGASPAAGAPAESAQCVTARTNLTQLDSGIALGVDSNGDGKPDGTLTPEQRAAQKQLAQSAIAVHCKPAAPAAPAPATTASADRNT